MCEWEESSGQRPEVPEGDDVFKADEKSMTPAVKALQAFLDDVGGGWANTFG